MMRECVVVCAGALLRVSKHAYLVHYVSVECCKEVRASTRTHPFMLACSHIRAVGLHVLLDLLRILHICSTTKN